MNCGFYKNIVNKLHQHIKFCSLGRIKIVILQLLLTRIKSSFFVFNIIESNVVVCFI